MTTGAPTLDQVLDLATRLVPADQARLIARLAPQLERTLEPVAHSSARALLAHAGTWEGNDLPERLAEVYATRQPLEA